MSVGGLQFTKKTYIIFIIIGVLAVAGVAGYLSMQPSTASTKPKLSETITITILKDVGINTVTYQNYDNPGEIKTLTIIELPYSFNASRGDTVEFTETTRPGYSWNSWDFQPMGRGNRGVGELHSFVLDTSDELYCYNNKIIVKPTCNFERVIITPAPTPSPTPFISPSPTPIE